MSERDEPPRFALPGDYFMDAALEADPTSSQKSRLTDFLTELKIVMRNHGFLVVDYEDGVGIYDMKRDRLVGMGVTYLLTAPRQPQASLRGEAVDIAIGGFDLTDSILDGVWPVDTEHGVTEQRLTRPVHPEPDVEPDSLR